MDLAYDHIQEETFRKEIEEAAASAGESSTGQPQSTLNADLQDAYRALSSSAWGVRIGGFLGNVVKQVKPHGLYSWPRSPVCPAVGLANQPTM